MAEPHPNNAPHVGERASFKKIEELAREELRKKGLTEKEIDWQLRRATRKPN
jgi:hypothetical protein